MQKKSFCLFLLSASLSAGAQLATDNMTVIMPGETKGSLAVFQDGKILPMLCGNNEWPGVRRAFSDLRSDLEKVTGVKPEMYSGTSVRTDGLIIAGTIGKSEIIDRLVKRRKIDTSGLSGRWERYLIQVVKRPLPGVKKALVIAGSDKRGTIYGIYEISKQSGVSPWYWWADVPVKRSESLYAARGPFFFGSPSVRYRGIFLNDEAPALTNWVRYKYGMIRPSENPPVPGGVANYGREFYSRIFELLLRLKGNYLWPAMWNNAFNEDDPENPRLADEYGIVMGNSHQEPMLRAQKEWDRRYIRKLGTWNYAKHPEILEAFWREGIRRNKDYESIVTIGLRGANDTEMTPGGPQANMTLLEKIVAVQRKILTEEYGKDVNKIPQLWCLYKEVQDYYNSGMRVPDDVTLLWAEDNWGNIRRLPTADERKRPGGAGIYYHFDYHGGPRSYQWINTNPVSKIWDQMSLAKQYGADRIWIVNAGHFRGYEIPVEYFLDLAWNTGMHNSENTSDFTRKWAEREFGRAVAGEIAEIVTKYTKFNSRRKPELLSPTTYSLTAYREAETIVKEYSDLAARALKVKESLEPGLQDAYYHLVLFPVLASSLVNELYFSAGMNDLYSRQGRAAANIAAKRTRDLFSNDTALMGYYNRKYAGGRWNHFMDQAHLGYTGWADPPSNTLRAIKLKEIEIPPVPMMGVSPEGSGQVWPGGPGDPVLPEFDSFNRQSYYIEVINAGSVPFEYEAVTDRDWISFRREKMQQGTDERLFVSVDWDKFPGGSQSGTIKISGTGSDVDVKVTAHRREIPLNAGFSGFIEANGYVSMEAEHYSSNSESKCCRWEKIEDYGHTLSAMRAFGPADVLIPPGAGDSPCLEYSMWLFTMGAVTVDAMFAPTLNFIPWRGLKYSISLDNQKPEEIVLVPEDFNARNGNAEWEKTVSDNIRHSISKHFISSTGPHVLKIRMIDPGIVLQKIVVSTDEIKPSYLGPPESYRIIN